MSLTLDRQGRLRYGVDAELFRRGGRSLEEEGLDAGSWRNSETIDSGRGNSEIDSQLVTRALRRHASSGIIICAIKTLTKKPLL